MGMAKAEGIYLSADYRVTEHPSGKLVDDVAIKFLTIHYPPDQTGPKAIMAYTGLAFAPDGTPMGTWLRETLRGETEVFDRSMAHLRERLDRDIAPTGWPIIVDALALHGNQRFIGGLTNLKFTDKSRKKARTTKRFEYILNEVPDAFVFANGSGAAKVLAEGHFEKVRRLLSVRPRRVEDHMNLLAAINRKVAAKTVTVSPPCHVSYVNGDDTTGPTSRTFTEPGESVPFEMPMLLFGIDLTDNDAGLPRAVRSVLQDRQADGRLIHRGDEQGLSAASLIGRLEEGYLEVSCGIVERSALRTGLRPPPATFIVPALAPSLDPRTTHLMRTRQRRPLGSECRSVLDDDVRAHGLILIHDGAVQGHRL
jgi:hypothetical protein